MKMLKTNKGGKKCPQDFGGEEKSKSQQRTGIKFNVSTEPGKFIARHTITLADYRALAPMPASISQTYVRWRVRWGLTMMSQNRLVKGQRG